MCCSFLIAFSDLANAFPNGEIANLFHAEWVMAMIRETRQNRDYSSRTIDVARWARESTKKQMAMTVTGQA